MGPTGAGKSSFIDKATESTGKGVGHDLRSCTSEIKVTRCAVERSNVVLVDTPGFDDTTKSDLEILEMISNWLNQEYQTGTMLSAILYFHRISDNRMAGTPLKNLRVFQKLCGKNAMPKVVLVTTMWDEVDDEVGEQRLAELQDSYWKAMMSRGSTTRKYLNTRESAVELLGFIVQQERAQEGVRLQEEISDMNLELRETAAGRVLCSTLEDLAKKRMEALRRIQAENKGADEKTSEDLWKEYAQVKAQLDSALTEARALRMSLRQRLNKGIRAAWRSELIVPPVTAV
ncbi:P-loop containing nucleoside triphosphate hydrolase protein [Pisolithus orientalis]|uniref:P-loop containing nucleoside triphosphate hydrolase protein n=1 Tax=Pisolithus orientalis TaxID=936130 RepID=UPI00222480DB|nr:P-loop containing nucleoside triphosphate hydrolase protein [Pisolithus orientalis]KAI5981048.1 P-loop containing nucleoside triphosphate hydrolase protein [Pisolithus orientalis]